MIKRYSRAEVLRSTNNSWVHDADAKNLKLELDLNNQALVLINERVGQLQLERDQLAARVDRLYEFMDSYADYLDAYYLSSYLEDIKALKEEPTTTSLQAHDKALLLRLADEEEARPVKVIRVARIAWLRAKAEEL